MIDFYINPDEKELFNKYRDKVFEAFYPKRGYKYKLKDGKQAISDFKKTGTFPNITFRPNALLRGDRCKIYK